MFKALEDLPDEAYWLIGIIVLAGFAAFTATTCNAQVVTMRQACVEAGQHPEHCAKLDGI